ncbi:MAG: hypothetical protein JWQ40_4553 [Segetibacter sp.]|nr:hypothetical protein [Segetibacter sp.]
MKLSITSTFHYIVFALVLLFAPANMVTVCSKLAEVKSEINEQVPIAKENTNEILHSEILFRY